MDLDGNEISDDGDWSLQREQDGGQKAMDPRGNLLTEEGLSRKLLALVGSVLCVGAEMVILVVSEG